MFAKQTIWLLHWYLVGFCFEWFVANPSFNGKLLGLLNINVRPQIITAEFSSVGAQSYDLSSFIQTIFSKISEIDVIAIYFIALRRHSDYESDCQVSFSKTSSIQFTFGYR